MQISVRCRKVNGANCRRGWDGNGGLQWRHLSSGCTHTGANYQSNRGEEESGGGERWGGIIIKFIKDKNKKKELRNREAK